MLLDDQSAVLGVDGPQLFISFYARWHFTTYIVPGLLFVKLYYIFLFVLKLHLILRGKERYTYQRGVYNQFHWRVRMMMFRCRGEGRGE